MTDKFYEEKKEKTNLNIVIDKEQYDYCMKEML